MRKLKVTKSHKKKPILVILIAIPIFIGKESKKRFISSEIFMNIPHDTIVRERNERVEVEKILY
jgi:hypothetical protein